MLLRNSTNVCRQHHQPPPSKNAKDTGEGPHDLLLTNTLTPSHHPNPSSHISLVHVCVYSRKLALYDYFTGNLMYADRQRKTFLNSCHGSEWLLSLRPFKARKKSTTMSSFYPPCLRYYQSKSWEQL